MVIGIPAGVSPATGKARHGGSKLGQKKDGEDLPLTLRNIFCPQTRMAADPVGTKEER